MLYHIVSDTEKLVQFRWSGFFSYQQTGTTCNGISYRHLPSDWKRMDVPSIFPNRIFWNFSHKPLFHNAISKSVRHSIFGSDPMVWIFYLSTNRNYLQRNQLSAPTLGPETLTQYFFFFQIESSGTFLTSHFSTMLYHIVQDTPILGHFRWSGFFSYQQTGTTCNGINYRHLSSDPNRIDISFIFSKSNLLELFSQATFPRCYITQCQTLKNWVSSDGLDFFPINKPELHATKSTIGVYPRTETAQIFLPSLPNRIFWNFSHKPLFHNAISHSVRHSIIRSFPMVWICFLSTNRNYLQRNQLSAPTLGPETHTQYFYLFQIESSGTFLTSHFATMLYHIVSDNEKLVQFRWSGFFSYQQTGTTCNGINYRHLPSDRNRIDIPSIFSQIESSGTFLTSHFSTMLYHIV